MWLPQIGKLLTHRQPELQALGAALLAQFLRSQVSDTCRASKGFALLNALALPACLTKQLSLPLLLQQFLIHDTAALHHSSRREWD